MTRTGTQSLISVLVCIIFVLHAQFLALWTSPYIGTKQRWY